jgi:phosphoribosyl-AMP cyclohydrolase
VTTPSTTVESADPATIEETAAFEPRFNADGLIPAIATAAASGEVLMFAYMNGEALARTLETGEAHFWSRSRGKLWRKGEESGNTMRVVELRTDCDQDALWLKVEMGGTRAGCHTGRRSCFYRAVPLGGSSGEGITLRFVDAERVIEP